MLGKAVMIMFVISLASPLAWTGPEQGSMTNTESDVKREAEILYTFAPPVLDGSIGALEWQTGFTSRYFDAFDLLSFREVYPETGSDEEFTNQSDLSVTFYLMYDDMYLYFAANVTDDVISVDSGPTFWRDDGIELLLDGAHDMDEDQRADDPWPGYQDGTTLLVLADGSLYYDYGTGTPYERFFGVEDDWYAAVRTVPSSNYYTVEMRVRLDALSSPLPDSTIGLNVGVNDDDTGGTSKTALKWTGRETLPGENPTFKNESLWGVGHMRTYVKAGLPRNLTFDEDTEVHITSDLCTGNHPDLDTGANYTWNVPMFEEGAWNNITMYGPDLIHTFSEPKDSCQVRLEVRDPANITDEAVTYIRIRDVTHPVLHEEDGFALEEVPYTYFLNATDNVGIAYVNWSLLDTRWVNVTTGGTAFVHEFMHPGNYTLGFEVFDGSGNTASGSARITVIDDVPPLVDEVEDVIMNTSHPVGLDATGAWDDGPDGPYTDLFFAWKFRSPYAVYDLPGPQPELRITVPGSYNATLTVTDRAGLSTVRNFNATVLDTTPPVIDLLIPSEMNADRPYGIDANATYDNDPLFWNGSSFTWTLSYSDGNEWTEVMEGPHMTVVFPHPGDGVIELTVEDPSGNLATSTLEVTVVDAIPPYLMVSIPLLVDQGHEFLIDITGSSDNVGIVSVHYSISLNISGIVEEVFSTPFFGIRIGNVSPEDYGELEDLMVLLNDPGMYVIEVHVKDAAGLSSPSWRSDIKVKDSVPPRARLNISLVVVNPGMTVHLSASPSSDEIGPLLFTWLVDGEELEQEGPDLAWTPPGIGEYNVTVTVSDGDGNIDRASALVRVIEPARVADDKDPYLRIYVLWAVVLLTIILGTLALYLWAVKRKRSLAGQPEE